MKKITLISTFCDTEEKQKVLRENISRVKELGTDVMVISPIEIPQDIVKICDYFLFIRENPILPLDIRKQLVWRCPNSIHNIRHTLIFKDYGWASLYQLKRLLEFSNNLDYDIFYLMIYDLKIDDEIEKIFTTNETNYFFPNRGNNSEDGTLFTVGTVFGIFDKENCKRIFTSINLEDYLNCNSAERYYHLMQENLKIPIHSKITTDLVYSTSLDLFNVGNSDKVKIFVSTNDDPEHRGQNFFAVHIYDVLIPVHIKIFLNENVYENLISEEKIFLNPDLSQDFFDFWMEIDGEKIDVNLVDPNVKSEIKINDNNDWEYIKNYLYDNGLIF
jgi:hypothetical protein